MLSQSSSNTGVFTAISLPSIEGRYSNAAGNGVLWESDTGSRSPKAQGNESLNSYFNTPTSNYQNTNMLVTISGVTVAVELLSRAKQTCAILGTSFPLFF